VHALAKKAVGKESDCPKGFWQKQKKGGYDKGHSLWGVGKGGGSLKTAKERADAGSMRGGRLCRRQESAKKTGIWRPEGLCQSYGQKSWASGRGAWIVSEDVGPVKCGFWGPENEVIHRKKERAWIRKRRLTGKVRESRKQKKTKRRGTRGPFHRKKKRKELDRTASNSGKGVKKKTFERFQKKGERGTEGYLDIKRG